MSTEKHTHITTVKTLMTASIIYFFAPWQEGFSTENLQNSLISPGKQLLA